jgi:phosphoglycolate phosphatase-like HAD superfamily hydrolase
LKAVLCDLDGTLADLNGRHPLKEMDKCGDDLLHAHVADALSVYNNAGYVIILMSGRSDNHRETTEAWLKRYHIQYHALLMRAEGDYRADEIVKAELYEAEVAPSYDVRVVFDDRPKVIRMWKEKGLKVFNCGDCIEF